MKKLFLFIAALAFSFSAMAEVGTIVFDFEDNTAHRTSGTNTYGTNTYTENSVTISMSYFDAVSSTKVSGSYNATGRVAKNTTNSPVITFGPISITDKTITGISYNQMGSTAITQTLEYSTDNSTWNSGVASFSTTSAKTPKATSTLSVTGTNLYIRITGSVSSLTNSNRDFYVDDVTITYSVATGKTETTTSFQGEAYTAYIGEAFTAPTATVTGGTGLTPTYSSEDTDVATINSTTGAVTLVAPGTTTITASYAGDDTYDESHASYTLTVGRAYSSLAALVEAGEPTSTALPVKVTLTNEVIQSVALNAAGTSRLGIMLKSGEQDVEIFKSGVPESWSQQGTVSGTITGNWVLYGSTWEVQIADWTQLTYTAPAVQKYTPTFTLSIYKTTLSTADAADAITVTYNGDATLVASSSTPATATASVAATAEDNKYTLTVTPVAVGTTTITVTAPETDNYYAASKEYTLTVVGPQVTFDLSKDETTTATINKLEWANVNVTMTADKGTATSNANNYYPGTPNQSYASTRFYKNSTLTFAPATGITLGEIVVTTTSADYATALMNSTWTNATATAHTSSAPYTVTITPTVGTQAVAATMGATVGATGVVVNYTGTAAAALNKIELSGTYPTQFSQGDAFSHEGMIVTATYTDASTQDVSASATFSGYNMATPGQQTVTVSYTDNGVTKTADYNITIARQMTPATAGYETVDFTEIEPYASLTGNGTETVADYSGLSFDMFFAKPESSTTPTKYYNNGTSVRAYEGNTITITGAENIESVFVDYVVGKEDAGATITGIGTTTAVITFSTTCRFKSITISYTTQATLSISEAGYATYYNENMSFVMPTGLVGITVVGQSSNSLTLEESYAAGSVVPAGEPVVLKGAKGNYGVYAAKTAHANVTDNMLQGNQNAGTVAEVEGTNKYYKLFNGTHGIGWYLGAADGGVFTLGANKAYLALYISGDAPAHFSLTDETTAVENVEATDANAAVKFIENGQLFIKKNGVIYNAMGQIVR